MTDYEKIDFSPIIAIAGDDEVVTHSVVRDVRLGSGKVLALITLDNGRDHTRPNTLGPKTLAELGETLQTLRARAKSGEIQAVGITGKQYILAAGADLSDITKVGSRDNARLMGLADQVTILHGGVDVAPPGPYDLVLANITAPAVRDIAGQAFAALCPGGYYITTGFTEQFAESVREAMRAAGLHVVDTRIQGEWYSVLGRRPDEG